MRFLWVLCLLSLALGASARVGLVRTSDGRAWQGHVRFTPGKVIVVNSEQNSVAELNITNVTLISFPTNGVAATEVTTDGQLPAPWRESDVGLMRMAGSTRHESGMFTVRSSGMSLDGDTDSFHYVYKSVRGDTEIVAEVVSIQYTHPLAKAGLMIRQDVNEYSPYVMIGLTAERGGALQFRGREGFPAEFGARRQLSAPMWLKLRRRGNEFTALTSPNGRLWTMLEKVVVPMNEVVHVGLAVTSAQDGMLNWTTFSKVREAPKLVNENFVPEVELTSGSVVRGRPNFANDDEITFAGAPKVVRAPVSKVARIAYHPLNGDMGWKTRVSRPGVWVTTGDFFDGDLRGIENGRITISSVLYGLRAFESDEEVLAVVLHGGRPRPLPFQVETADGATVLASAIGSGDGELLMQEPALGQLRIPAFEILELRKR